MIFGVIPPVKHRRVSLHCACGAAGIFFKGKNNISLDLEVTAEFKGNKSDVSAYNGVWQFQYDNGMKDNFFMAILVDGKSVEILVPTHEQ